MRSRSMIAKMRFRISCEILPCEFVDDPYAAVEMKQLPPLPPLSPADEPDKFTPRPEGSTIIALAMPSASPIPPSWSNKVIDFLFAPNSA